jgi:hypothetical protein
MELQFSWQIFEKYSNNKIHDTSSGSGVVPCGRTDGRKTERHTNMTKLIVVFEILRTRQKIEKFVDSVVLFKDLLRFEYYSDAYFGF